MFKIAGLTIVSQRLCSRCIPESQLSLKFHLSFVQRESINTFIICKFKLLLKLKKIHILPNIWRKSKLSVYFLMEPKVL